MNASTTANVVSPIWLDRGTELSVRFFDRSKEERSVLRVQRPLSSIQQIGQSYQVRGLITPMGKAVSVNKSFFLKLPHPVIAESRDELRNRFENEMRRGLELNELIDNIETEKHPDLSFSIPRFIQAGFIERIDSHDATSKHLPYGTSFRQLPFILYEWVNGVQLDALVKDHLDKHPITRDKWFDFARGLANVIRRLHNHGFLHGHIVPRNILFSKKKYFLAGFGYSALSFEGVSQPHPILDEDEPYRAPEFRHEPSLDALWHSADIYAIGVVLFFLATGKAIVLNRDSENESVGTAFPESRKALKHLKETVRKLLASGATDHAIKQDFNIAKIVDNCIRFCPDDRFETADELLDAVDIARLGEGKRRSQSFFEELLVTEKRGAVDRLERIRKRRHYEIYGSRTKIIEGLCRLVGALTVGSIYRTVTLPSYWTSRNLGPDGRFLAMNKHVAKQGVEIERIFLVDGPFHALTDEEQEILRSQQDAVSQVKGSLHVRVCRVPRSDILNFERSGQSVAFVEFPTARVNKRMVLERSSGKYLCLNFISRGKEKPHYGKRMIERKILKVRIWDPGRGDAYWRRCLREADFFRTVWEKSSTLTLEEYLAPGTGPTLASLLSSGRPSDGGGQDF